MGVTVENVEEIKHYLKTRQKTIEEIASESWDPLCVIGLRIAFKKGYEAKHFFNKKKNSRQESR